ncbi:MAG: hypothetical protein ACLR8P_14875 [Clostridium fessum]
MWQIAGTTAQQNHDYFEGLKDQSGSNTVSVSSNFVIGTGRRDHRVRSGRGEGICLQ